MSTHTIQVLIHVAFVCSALAAVENFLVIVVLAGTKQLRLKYYGFVFNLAFADFLFAVFQAVQIRNRFPVLIALAQSCYLVSVLTIMAVAINRYLALSLMPPARYDALVTRGRLVGACLFLWCIALMAYVIPTSVASVHVFFIIKDLIRPVIVIGIWMITAVIYFLSFRKIKEYTPPLASSPGVYSSKDHVDARVRQTRRLLVTFTIILIASFVSWMPYCISHIVDYFHPTIFKDNEGARAIYFCAIVIYSLNAMIDPLIYWWRLDGFREGFYSLFFRCCMQAESTETKVGNDHEETIAETVM